MNQMTAVVLADVTDRYTITGTGYGLEGTIQHTVGASASMDEAVLPFLIASDAKLEGDKVVGDPTEGALLVLAHKAGVNIDGTRENYPRVATLPFDPTYKLMATFNKTTDASGKEVVRCLRQGRGAGGDAASHVGLGRRRRRPARRRPPGAGPRRSPAHGGRGSACHGRGVP